MHISFQNDKNNNREVARTVYIELVSHFSHGEKPHKHKVKSMHLFLKSQVTKHPGFDKNEFTSPIPF